MHIIYKTYMISSFMICLFTQKFPNFGRGYPVCPLCLIQWFYKFSRDLLIYNNQIFYEDFNTEIKILGKFQCPKMQSKIFDVLPHPQSQNQCCVDRKWLSIILARDQALVYMSSTWLYLIITCTNRKLRNNFPQWSQDGAVVCVIA